MQALQNFFVFFVGSFYPYLGAVQLLHVEGDAQRLFHAFPNADHHPVQILHMQRPQYGNIGGIGLVYGIQRFFRPLHPDLGHINAKHCMPQRHQGGGHAQAKFAKADNADFQFFFRHNYLSDRQATTGQARLPDGKLGLCHTVGLF